MNFAAEMMPPGAVTAVATRPPTHDEAWTATAPGEFAVFRRGDPAFAALVGRTFERLARDRGLGEIYGRWFSRRLPTGELLGLPMSPQLTKLFRMLGAPD